MGQIGQVYPPGKFVAQPARSYPNPFGRRIGTWSGLFGKPCITVSPIGMAETGIINAGADFGPDTPGTQTSGIQEALNSIPYGGRILLINDALNPFPVSAPIILPSTVNPAGHLGNVFIIEGTQAIQENSIPIGIYATSNFNGTELSGLNYLNIFQYDNSAGTGAFIDVYLKNLFINNSSGINGVNPNVGSVAFQGIRSCFTENCVFEGNQSQLYLNSAGGNQLVNVWINNCTIASYFNTGIRFGSGGGPRESYIKNNRIYANYNGIEIDNYIQTVIEGNRIERSAGGGQAGVAGIYVNIPASVSNISNILISNNIFDNLPDAGIYISMPTGVPTNQRSWGSIIHDNIFNAWSNELPTTTGALQSAIYVASGTTGLQISRNFYYTGGQVDALYGIYAEDAFSTLTSNDVKIDKEYDIMVEVPTPYYFGGNKASSSTPGTTSGTVNMLLKSFNPELRRYVIIFSSYENDTTTAQTINFPLPFSSKAVISANNTGLTISASTSGITITSPDSTALFNGIVIVEGY